MLPISHANTVYRTRSQIAVGLLRLDGKPVNLDDYPMFLDIYDGDYKSTLLKTSRQIGKSTTLSNFSIAESIAMEHFRTLFVAPTQEQTHKFSTERVGKTLTYSPIVQQRYVAPGNSDRVLVRSLKTGSTIYFSYAKDNADRCRGITADRTCYDEIQDMNLEMVVPVVRETMANSDYSYEMFCGTPKSMENDIESYWQASSMTEWAIKCSGCGRYSIIISEKQLSHKGPVCTRCDKLLNPRNGTWVDTCGHTKWITKGFHVSRAIMPISVPVCWPEGPRKEKAKEKWADVMNKLEGPNASSLTVFRNEVLGVSDSVGVRLLSLADLKELCTGLPYSDTPTSANVKDLRTIACGIDWSGGGEKITSRTVLVIVGLTLDGRIRVMNYKVFPGTGPQEEINQITTLIKNYDRHHPVFIVGDAGEGNSPMDTLRNRFQPQRVVKVRYSGSMKQYVKYNQESTTWMVNKPVAVDSMMTFLKAGNVTFPANYEASKSFFDDILNEHVEVGRDGNKRWTHANNKPDDSLHALIFARIATQLATRSLDLGSYL